MISLNATKKLVTFSRIFNIPPIISISMYRTIGYGLAFAAIGITLSCIFQLDHSITRQLTNNAVWIVFSFLILGFVALLFQFERLMLIFFGCCGVLSFYLNQATNNDIAYPGRMEDMEFSTLHLNLSSVDSDVNETLDLLKNSDAHIISLVEVSPLWDSILRTELIDIYPHQYIKPNFDLSGIGVMSKYPFQQTLSFKYNDSPNLAFRVKLPGLPEPVHFISTQTLPSWENKEGYRYLKSHLDLIVQHIDTVTVPVMTIGTFNTVAWTSEIQDFQKILDLKNSRRDINPFSQSDYDHIFFSPKLECTAFNELYVDGNTHLGIFGTYQTKKEFYAKPADKEL